jgi:hypothetical protein
MGFASVLAAIRDAGSLATALVNGSLSAADFAKLAAIPAGNFPATAIITPKIDLLATGDTALFPAKAGYYFFAIGRNFIITDATGVQTSPVHCSAGNNAGKTNLFTAGTANPTNADVAAAVGATGMPFITAGPGLAIQVKLLDLAAPILFNVSAAAVGPTVLKVRLEIVGWTFPTSAVN